MSSTSGPTLPKRRIARELKLLREDRGVGLEEVARRTEVSTSTLSRLENAQGAANPLTMKALVHYYKLENTERGERLVRWAKDGRKQGWWTSFGDTATWDNASTYAAYEAQASRAHVYVFPFMPVLLHTEGYTRALAAAWNPAYTEAELDQLVKFRRRRQEVLTKRPTQDPLKLETIMHEACLTQQVGDTKTMREQLTKLIDVIEDSTSNVTLQVLRQDSRPHHATRYVWAHFSYEDEATGEVDQKSNVTLLENHVGDFTLLERPEDVQRSAKEFEELSDRALSPAASAELIGKVIATKFSR